jgi:hypothetical protein
MNNWDKDNLKFIMGISGEAFDEWLNQADDDDIDYALELVQRARTELTVKAMEIIDEAIEDSNKGDYIIAKGYLQKYTLNK